MPNASIKRRNSDWRGLSAALLIGPVSSLTSSTSEPGKFSHRPGRKKRPKRLTDASLKLLHQVLRFIAITGKRQIYFQIESVIFVLIVLVIEFAALLCLC